MGVLDIKNKWFIIFLVLSVLAMGYAIKDFVSIGSADQYIDKGINTFYPEKIKLGTKKQTKRVRHHTNTSSKIVHKVVYKPKERSPYFVTVTFNNEEDAREVLKAGEPITKKVFSIRDKKRFITVEPDYTPSSYVWGQRFMALCIFVLGGVVFAFLFVFGILPFIKAQKAGATLDDESSNNAQASANNNEDVSKDEVQPKA